MRISTTSLSKLQGNVDALSGLPLEETPSSTPLPGDTVLMLEALDSSSSVTSAAIKSWTGEDPVLSCVHGFVLHGNWEPVEQDANFRPFKNRELELSVQDGCLLWGNRVVVPKPGRKMVLGMLHDSHPGITRMKALVRGIVWWPGIDGDLESQVKSCQACQVNRKSLPVTLLYPWEFPPRPWARLHINFAGPFMGNSSSY